MATEDNNFECPKRNLGCEAIFGEFNDLLHHCQIDCTYFGSKYFPVIPKELKKTETYPIPNYTKFIINNELANEEEQPECYLIAQTQPQRNRILKKSEKQIKAGPQKFVKYKDIYNTEDLEISKCILKSSLIAVIVIENTKKNNYLVAYPNSNFEIIINDIDDSTKSKIKIVAHNDIITEIKYVKLDNSNGHLFSCSYDYTCKAWSILNWKNIVTINFGNWVTSCTVFKDKFKTGNIFICCCGGFNPNFPIKFYNIEGENKGEIKIKDNSTSIVISHYHDEVNQRTLILNSTDNEKGSCLKMFELHNLNLIRTFPSEKYCTKSEFHIDNSNSLIITYVDFKGILKQYNVDTGKPIRQLNIGTNCLDLISFDDEYFISCGDFYDNSYKIIHKDGLQIVKVYSHVHSSVILNLAYLEHSIIGKLLISLGADKKISIFSK